MSTWIETLGADLKTEFGDKPPTTVFATVRFAGHTPAATARTVVLRELDAAGAMLITSDARSEKNSEVRHSPQATLLYWLASTKRQFRVCGPVDFPTDHRQRIWSALSDRARALFVWPPPGRPRTEAEFAKEMGAGSPMPATFEVLRLTPTEVETLDLNGHPHERVRWTRVDDRWSALRVNP